MDDVQVTQLHGTSENPARVSKRVGHSKSEQLPTLVSRINADISRIPDFLCNTGAHPEQGLVTQVTSPEEPVFSSEEIFIRLNQWSFHSIGSSITSQRFSPGRS